MPPPNPHASGWAARRVGEPMSACPYELNTAAGLLWRRGWIQAENLHREHGGRMGEPSERWEEARRMVAAEYLPDPCQEVSDNLEELARGGHDDERTSGGTVPDMARATVGAYTTRLLVRPAGAPADAWRDLGPVRSATFTVTPPSGKTDTLTDAIKRATAALGTSFEEAAAALGALGRSMGLDTTPSPPPPAAPEKRQTLCPSHGVELRGGGCPRCQREQQRRQNRLRR